MSYKVEYTEKALKFLKKLDKFVLIVIKAWIDKNLVGTSNPKKTGKGLTSNRSGQWRYRIRISDIFNLRWEDFTLAPNYEIGRASCRERV